jgi:hypothetical protein
MIAIIVVTDLFPRHGRACPAIPVFDLTRDQDVDARHKAGHDESNIASVGVVYRLVRSSAISA